ncbi:MAG TPA: efflux RND transporter permease subunit [Gammaproteobacteria bacterium]
MKLTELSLGNHIAVAVAVLLILLFGILSLLQLPIQLTPEIQEPEITIATYWRAASPNEIEAEIIEPQEDVLRGLPGMLELESKAQNGRGEISIRFAVDMDIRRALIEVLNRLNQVPSYPEDADEPTINSVGSDARAIAWFIIKPKPGNDIDISTYKDFVEEVVQTRFERIPGVARSEIYGGSEYEVRIEFDPYKAASLGIELPVVSRLAASGEDISGGFSDIGKREYSIRFAGKYQLDDLGSLIIDWREGYPVFLRDVATVSRRQIDQNSFTINNGDQSITINAQRETGVNVLEIMKGLRNAVTELQNGPLDRAGLYITQVYDETAYIDNSIIMLSNNLGMGIILAVLVLWWFLRRFRATLMVAASIPICIVGSFIFMALTGRTLNVISLAGLAFAVGMVLDASIVVLENIVRLREHGEDKNHASLHGAGQVMGALIASTATTVAIFLPIVFMRDEAGQLFADLALTISAAVCISLVVAITVVPTLANRYLGKRLFVDPHHQWWEKISDFIMTMTDTFKRRIFWIVILILVPGLLAWTLLPKADYLPEGNRNLVFAFILPPPGANIKYLQDEMGNVIAEKLKPYLDDREDPEVKNYFFVAFSRGVFLGVRTEDPTETEKLIPLLNSILRGFPDTIGIVSRASLFGSFGEGRTVDMDLQGRDIAALMEAALQAFILIQQKMPGSSVRPFPGLELAQPELRLIPNDRRISEAGWDRGVVANMARAFGDGLYVGDYFDGEQTLDIIVRSYPWKDEEELASLPISTPGAGIIPLSELIEIKRTSGPEEIRRINRRRTVTLRVTPPESVSLEDTVTFLKNEIAPEIQSQLPPDGSIRYAGTADKLESALDNMKGSFLLAVAILYLLMSALFRSFKDSLLVIMSIPLATVGGVIALKLINAIPALLGFNFFQRMDLLTMIGFIILLGIVVNNAILLVYQARMSELEGMNRREAVSRAVHIRLRPIMMSTLTTIFGMLPLMLIPGAGTELYRGLASVIIGGMFISAVFTLLLLPSLLRMGEQGHRQAS